MGGQSDAHLDHAWRALGACFRDVPYPLTRHHLDSFDRFVRVDMPSIIGSMNRLTVTKAEGTVDVFLGGVDGDRLHLDRPTIVDADGASRPLYPNEARLKDLTYAANLYADVVVRAHEPSRDPPTSERVFEAVHIGSMPIMLHSPMCVLRGMPPEVLREMGECVYDQGGYFVVDGKEKVIVTREDAESNAMFLRGPGEDGSRQQHHTGAPVSGADAHVVARAYVRSFAENDRFPHVTRILVRSQRAPSRGGAIYASVTHLSEGGRGVDEFVPLFVLFRALGVESDRAIMEHVVYDVNAPEVQQAVVYLRASAAEAASLGVFDQRSAIAALVPRTRYKTAGDLKQVMVRDLFPDLGEDFAAKALYLGLMVARTLAVATGGAPATDRDDYRRKRLLTSGALLGDLFRDVFRRLRDQCLRRLDQEYYYGPWRSGGGKGMGLAALVTPANLRQLLPPAILTMGLMRSFKGSWGGEDDPLPSMEESADGEAGVVQDLSRTSYMTYIAHVRRVNNPIDRSVKMAEPHRLLASHWGALCPVESPDGPNIGLLNHLATMAQVSQGASVASLRDAIQAAGLVVGLREATAASTGGVRSLQGACSVFFNGTWAGIAPDPVSLVQRVRRMRRQRMHGTPADVSVAWDIVGREVRVSTERGRVCRPLVRMGPDRRPMLGPWLAARREPWSWDDLFVGEGCPMEWLDTAELAGALVAMTPHDAVARPTLQFTHCELHPGGALSFVTNTHPLLHHNAGSYNVLTLAQFKQAVGTYATNWASRMDVMASVLHHPQRPLVSTDWADVLCRGRLAHGENLVVAIATYTGYNMEDAVLVNLDSVQRGRMHLTYFKTVTARESVRADGSLVFANPLRVEEQGREVRGLRFARYAGIDDNGMPKRDTPLGEDDVLVGMVESRASPAVVRTSDGAAVEREAQRVLEHTDRSMMAGRGLAGMTVDRVVLYRGREGRCAKVRLRQLRAPELGDKVASRFGQKGVLGMLLPRADMPFGHASGVVPDLIINPNGFPKRQTVAHLLECLLGKACAAAGARVNANTFERVDAATAAVRVLQSAGLDRHGDEVLYNGRTGEQIACNVFVGMNYYGRLKHMVADKVNFRSGTGPVNAIVRQPTKGGGVHGGLRVGEMEQNALLSHGVSGFLKESFMERSDRHRMVVDAETGVPAAGPDTVGGAHRTLLHPAAPADPRDWTPPDFSTVEVPYAFKLMQQELQAMSIDARFTRLDRAEETLLDGMDSDDSASSAGGEGIDTDDAAHEDT